MTTSGDSSSSLAPIRIDGIDLTKLAQASIISSTTSVDDTHHFWSSAQRPMSSTHREVMQVNFGSKRLINHLSFKASRFPLVLEVQYLDANGDWQALTYAQSNHKKGPLRQIARNAVRLVLSESVPHQVNSARAKAHPQHFGKGHWSPESWKITPVTTSKIRFVIVRNHLGHPPVNAHRHRVPYSVAIKDLQIGYRAISKADVPTKPEPGEPWASTTDILGSRVVYSTYEQDASRAIDGSSTTFWRSEPQPFPFAVANMFLDVRGEDGEAPVIDRFWMDPVTVGPVCNVYFSNSVPTGDFDGLSVAVPAEFRTEVGNPALRHDGLTGEVYAIGFDPTIKTGVAISNVYERMRYDQPWWVGVDAKSLVGAIDPFPRPILSLGAVQVLQTGGQLQIVSQTGQKAAITLDPILHGTNTQFRLVAAYFPFDPATQRQSYVRLTYALPGFDPISTEVAIDALEDLDAPVKVGLHPDPDDTTIAAISIQGLVVKSESLAAEVEGWFLDEGADYIADAQSVEEDRGTAQNARLRMHPEFISDANPFGVVGGPGNRFGEMEWTPVSRDYTLKRGYLHVPPTKARYWKFEMTRLLPQVYENFLSIDRDVLVFPPDVVNHAAATTGGQTSNATPSGVAPTANLAEQVAYGDALLAVSQASAAADATTVLVVRDPVQAAQIAQTGWVWTYQPWHVGSTAPQFLGTQVHRYESLSVKHRTKVAFFAGIREITPFRVDYTFDDDTPEYVEHLLDDQFIETMTGLDHFEGGVRATSALGEIVSKDLPSYRSVRGVQFATQETDSFQVLDDPDFALRDFNARWTKYGDAEIAKVGPKDVVLNRGWFALTYADLERTYPTYGAMDGLLYGALEGNNPNSGYAEGGLTSVTYAPSGAGRVLALAEVSATDTLHSPVRVEIVSADTGKVVAAAQKRLQQNEKATLSVAYAPGTLETQSGGAAHRRTWGEVENFSSYVPIPVSGNVTVSGNGQIIGVGGIWADDNDATFATATYQGGLVHSVRTTLPPAVVGDSVDRVTVRVRARMNNPDRVAMMVALRDPTTQRGVGSYGFAVVNDSIGDINLEIEAYDPVEMAAALNAGAVLEIMPNTGIEGFDNTADNVLSVYQVDLQARGTAGATYGDLEGTLYKDIETWTDAVLVSPINGDLYVRVRQQGATQDSFHIHRIGLYDDPIAWFFSNDGGDHWWQAIDVRNDPHGVLMFPQALPADVGGEGVGTTLKWRAQFYREDAVLNALHIRPWYGNRSRTVERNHGLDALGPNHSIYDTFPATHQHPMWLPRFNPIERQFVEVEVVPFWRNLVPDPGGELVTEPSAATFETTGGSVEPVERTKQQEVPQGDTP